MVAFASPAQLEQATGGRIKASDPWAAMCLYAATESIRTVCGWHVAPVQSDTVMLDGTGNPTMFLPSLHVVSIEAVMDNTEPLIVADLEWSVNGAMDRSCWSRRRRGVVVSFTHGYSLEDVPLLVSLTCLVAARGRRGLIATGYVREQTGQMSAEHDRSHFALLPHEESMLREFILPRRA